MVSFSPQSAIGRLLLLRTIAIVLQLVMVLIGAFWFDKSLDLQPVLMVIAAEAIFQLVSVYAHRNTSEAAPLGMSFQLLADVVFMTVLLSLSGGASNAFVSMLLLPIVIAAVTLPRRYVLAIAMASVISYGYLFVTLPPHHVHHMDMHLHLQGMLVNYVVSVLVVVSVVMAMAKQLQQREKTLAAVREKQLKNEQLLALGGAAAQATHELATPIANMNLLFEELQEDYPDHPAIVDMAQALGRCRAQLDSFREQTEQFKYPKSDTWQTSSGILENLNTLMALQFPEQQLEVEQDDNCLVTADPMLIPALLNLLANAAQANAKQNKSNITITSQFTANKWLLVFRDQGTGIDPNKLQKLGHTLVKSDTGLGMALVISHASIERMSGSIQLENHPEGGAVTTITLPAHRSSQGA